MFNVQCTRASAHIANPNEKQYFSFIYGVIFIIAIIKNVSDMFSIYSFFLFYQASFLFPAFNRTRFFFLFIFCLSFNSSLNSHGWLFFPLPKSEQSNVRSDSFVVRPNWYFRFSNCLRCTFGWWSKYGFRIYFHFHTCCLKPARSLLVHCRITSCLFEWMSIKYHIW